MTVLTAFFVSMLVTSLSCQDRMPKPRFPDAFQTEVEGVFIKEREVVEIDASLYYDRTNNRAAFEYTSQAQTSRTIYNFNANEIISYDGNQCEVQDISDDPEEPTFFPFTMVNKKKKIVGPETVLYFDKSEFESQELILLPSLVYKVDSIAIPNYLQKDCEVMHFFSKKIELSRCKSTDECDPTLMAISVKCKGGAGEIVVDHTYKFYRFTPKIVDESVFLPPPGVYCSIKSAKSFPSFGSYFSFSYDIVEKLNQMENADNVFSSHSEVWFEKQRKLLRIDTYSENGILYSSGVFDVASGKSFLIIPVVSQCATRNISSGIKFGEVTRLPEFLFAAGNYSGGETVYSGKRIINGITFEVWSATWLDHSSAAKVVEEVFFLEVIPDQKMNEVPKESYLKISHIDIYTYEMKSSNEVYELTLLKHITINNYRTDPKEWSSFDVASCFNHEDKKDIYMKVKGDGIMRESEYYLQAVQHLYDKVTQITGASLLRFSELNGVFDGDELIGVKGSIIDNNRNTGFPAGEPRMGEIFNMMRDAAKKGELNAVYRVDNDTEVEIAVLDVLNSAPTTTAEKSSCYSGASMAAASIVLLLIGMSFGVAGYYVFLKKRRSASGGTLLNEMELPK